VGISSLHGFTDGEALLEPLPSPWKVRIKLGSNGYDKIYFINSLTGESTHEDPRLEALPSHWEELEAVRTPDDPLLFGRFRNKLTGEVRNSDPRLLPEALEKRGVKIETFELV
jgi:hypothetical protein